MLLIITGWKWQTNITRWNISFRQVRLFWRAVYLFEIATASLLPVHHVMEDGDHDIPQIGLRHQRHLQERTNHRWDKVQLVLPWRRDIWVRLSLCPWTQRIIYFKGTLANSGKPCFFLFKDLKRQYGLLWFFGLSALHSNQIIIASVLLKINYC